MGTPSNGPGGALGRVSASYPSSSPSSSGPSPSGSSSSSSYFNPRSSSYFSSRSPPPSHPFSQSSSSSLPTIHDSRSLEFSTSLPRTFALTPPPRLQRSSYPLPTSSSSSSPPSSSSSSSTSSILARASSIPRFRRGLRATRSLDRPPLPPTPPVSPNKSPRVTSLKMSQRDPPSPPLLGPREAALAEVLAKGTIEEGLAAFDEYAWRSLRAGVRVREYCAAASHAVRNAPPNGIRLALVHSPTRLLFPFALPAGAPPPPPPCSFIPPHAVAHLSSRQLVEAICRLATELDRPSLVEARVQELTLEYVGRRWRSEGGGFDAISRKLADVELEIVQTEPLASSVVLDALQELRFLLGLVNPTHLVGRLSGEGMSPGSRAEATQLLCAWTVRRLSTGLDPQGVADNLVSMRERLTGSSSDAVPDVLSYFCLDGRPTRSTTPSIVEEPRPRARTLSRIALRSKNRRTLPIPQWLSTRQSPNIKALQLESERRPSLPTLFSPPSDSDPTQGRSTPSSVTSSTCSSPVASVRHPSPHGQSSSSLANLLRLNDLPTERIALVDHLLSLRYRLGTDADSWFLGCGRDKAVDFLVAVEAAGEPHLQPAIAELRDSFGLPVIVIPTADHPPTPPPKATVLHQRDVSFDLEQYLDDIAPIGGDDKISLIRSVGSSGSPSPHGTAASTPPSPSPMRMATQNNTRASVSTIASVMTTASAATVTSLSDTASLSDVSIREATREVPRSAKATAYTFPARPRENAADDSVILPSALVVQEYHRFAKSMPDVNDMYTRLPDRPRPRSSKKFRGNHTPLLPPFDPETKRPALGLVGTYSPSLQQLASITRGYTFPPPLPSPAKLPPMSPVMLSPRRTVMDGGERSRRQNNRHWVIVDGTRVSPPADMIPLPKEPTSLTPLSAILALFRDGTDHLGTEAVERKLIEAVKNEEERLAAHGEAFDAEARARMGWLLEQVGRELTARPDLVAAVDRVLYKISSPSRWPGRSPSSYGISTPRNTLSQIKRMSSAKNLSIVVPPRQGAAVELEVDTPRPSTAGTFGVRSHSTPPSSPVREVSEDSHSSQTTPTLAYHTYGSASSLSPLRYTLSRPNSPFQTTAGHLARRSALRHHTTHHSHPGSPTYASSPKTNTPPAGSPSPTSPTTSSPPATSPPLSAGSLAYLTSGARSTTPDLPTSALIDNTPKPTACSPLYASSLVHAL